MNQSKTKVQIKTLIENHPQLQAKHQAFHQALQQWWTAEFLPEFYSLGDELAGSKGVFALRRDALNSIVQALLSEQLLSIYQIRGAMANNFKKQEADLKSIANSGWNAELIPDEEILQSEFSDVLANFKQDQTRINELEALFAAANESSDEDGATEESDVESGVLPKDQVKQLKADKKEHNGQLRDLKKQLKFARKEDPDKATALERKIDLTSELIGGIDARLEHHTALEQELKDLKAGLKEAEKKKDELIEAARLQISNVDAKILIEKRFRQDLEGDFSAYIRALTTSLVKASENLHDKYAVTVKEIMAERDREAGVLDGFLRGLGYE